MFHLFGMRLITWRNILLAGVTKISWCREKFSVIFQQLFFLFQTFSNVTASLAHTTPECWSSARDLLFIVRVTIINNVKFISCQFHCLLTPDLSIWTFSLHIGVFVRRLKGSVKSFKLVTFNKTVESPFFEPTYFVLEPPDFEKQSFAPLAKQSGKSYPPFF